MHQFHAETMATSLQAGHSRKDTSRASFAPGFGAVMRGVAKGLAALFGRQDRAERAIEDKYAGRGWNDETERELNSSIANSWF